MQILQPLAVGNIGFAPRNILYVMGVDQQDGESGGLGKISYPFCGGRATSWARRGFLAQKFLFGAYESPGVPGIALHHVFEKHFCAVAVVTVKIPIPNAAAHRIERQLAFRIR
jgi:hypothetical protein